MTKDTRSAGLRRADWKSATHAASGALLAEERTCRFARFADVRNLGAHSLDEEHGFMLIRWSMESRGAWLVGAVENEGEDATIQIALGP